MVLFRPKTKGLPRNLFSGCVKCSMPILFTHVRYRTVELAFRNVTRLDTYRPRSTACHEKHDVLASKKRCCRTAFLLFGKVLRHGMALLMTNKSRNSVGFNCSTRRVKRPSPTDFLDQAICFSPGETRRSEPQSGGLRIYVFARLLCHDACGGYASAAGCNFMQATRDARKY